MPLPALLLERLCRCEIQGIVLVLKGVLMILICIVCRYTFQEHEKATTDRIIAGYIKSNPPSDKTALLQRCSLCMI